MRDIHVALAARRLHAKAQAHLVEAYPNGDYENFPYYPILKAHMDTLYELGRKRHPFGRCVLRLSFPDNERFPLACDLMATLCAFLIEGCDAEARAAVTRDQIDAYGDRWESLALHETIGAYVKTHPGMERQYYERGG